jgi:hypothetical protein
MWRGIFMNRSTIAVLGLACVAGIAAYARVAQSADHLDSPATKADPAADIADVFAFNDGANSVFAMTLFPAATATGADGGVGAQFSDAVDYVFHTSSGNAYGTTTANEDITCTFTAAQVISCWAGTDEYVTGDASGTTGLSSADGKMKVFAGLRADPFFFNLDGFHHTEATVEAYAANQIPGVTPAFNGAGCPILDPGVAGLLRTQLTTSADGGAPVDFFANLNALAIVVSLDKSLVNKGGPLTSVWAGTYSAQ